MASTGQFQPLDAQRGERGIKRSAAGDALYTTVDVWLTSLETLGNYQPVCEGEGYGC